MIMNDHDHAKALCIGQHVQIIGAGHAGEYGIIVDTVTIWGQHGYLVLLESGMMLTRTDIGMRVSDSKAEANHHER